MSLKEKIGEMINEVFGESEEEKAERIRMVAQCTKGDKIALKADWTPFNAGGRRFKTSVLKEMEENIVVMKGSIMLYAIIIAVIVTGTTFISFQVMENMGVYFVPFSVIAGIVLGFYGIKLIKPKYFDKNTGEYYIGEGEKKVVVAELGEIYALQIIKKMCGSRNNKYYSYELNIIFKNSKRNNITDHSNYKSIKRDGEEIAEFLGIKLWDLSENR